MEYILGDKRFHYSYSELKDKYHEFCEMDNKTFISNIADAIHFACFVCFIKEVPTECCLSDMGIIHELVHILKGNPVSNIKKIRSNFKHTLKL